MADRSRTPPSGAGPGPAPGRAASGSGPGRAARGRGAAAGMVDDRLAMSTNLEAQLREQLTAAMKAKDLPTANLIRMINTKIMERRTAKGFSGTVDDALVLDVISTYKKSMEKARGDYVNAGDRGKEQLAEIDFEVGWCSKFLPQGLSEAELRDAVA